MKKKKNLVPKNSGPKKKDPSNKISFQLEEDARELFLREIEAMSIDSLTENIEEIFEPLTYKKKRAKAFKEKIDLHQLNLDQAKEKLDKRIDSFRIRSETTELEIITGKGIHSKGGFGVLSKEIHTYIQDRFGPYIQKIDNSPDEVKLFNLPLKGSFKVWLKF